MIIYNVRTSKIPIIESHASKPLFYLTLFSAILTICAPILLQFVPEFHYIELPPIFYLYLVLLVLLYLVLVSVVKKHYIKHCGVWL